MSIKVIRLKTPIRIVRLVGGVRGDKLLIRVNDGYIQTKYEPEDTWNNLLSLSELIGPRGYKAAFYVKWHAENSEVLLDEPSDYIGVYSGYAEEAPENFSAYKWYKCKGEKGDQGVSGVYVSTIYDLPNVGDPSIVYICTTENATYRWNESTQTYICVGRDYKEIDKIDGGIMNG